MQYKTERIGIHILAFMTARCSLLGLYPFVVPFFMAAYIQERSSVSLFLALLLGIGSTWNGIALCKYALVLLFLLVLLGKTDRKKMFSNHYQIALAAGVCLTAVSMPYQYLVTKNDSSIFYAMLDGVVAACFVLIFEKGFLSLRVGSKRMFADNERFIGFFALVCTALFGCPLIKEPINLLFVICGYLLLYNTFRFDSGLAIATGSITGLVLALRLEKVSYLAVMIVVAGLLVILRGLGKAGVLLSYLAGMLLLGVLYERTLLSDVMLRSVLMVLTAFFLTPSERLKRVNRSKKEITGASQDILIQEATRSKVQNFGQAFLAMEKMLSSNEADRDDNSIPNGLSNMYLSGDGISLLNAVESQSNRLSEMRKNFVKQLGQIGEIITTFQTDILEESVKMELFEGRLSEKLGRRGVVVTKAVLVRNKEGRLEVYVSCYQDREKVVTCKEVAELISTILGKNMICIDRSDDRIGEEESNYSFTEEGKYMLTTGVVRKNRSGESLCGDNFSVSKLDTQKAVLMLSDGMGSGKNAYVKSEQVVELLEQLLKAGFCREPAIELLNSFISFLADGNASATLDLTVIDFYTGMADFVKLGASTTFIRRSGTVECIRSTSLPVGVLEQIEFDTCARKLYHGDIIVMVSDGVLDGIIFENKETYLADLIASIETNNVQVIAEKIMKDVTAMQRGKMKDDSTVLAAGVWER